MTKKKDGHKQEARSAQRNIILLYAVIGILFLFAAYIGYLFVTNNIPGMNFRFRLFTNWETS